MARRGRRAGPAHCPGCHREVESTPILWGLPSSDGFEAAKRGDVVLGGCLVSESDPSHICPLCGTRLRESPDGRFDLWVPAPPFAWGDGHTDLIH